MSPKGRVDDPQVRRKGLQGCRKGGMPRSVTAGSVVQ
jgi:hypothetical protein